MQVSLSSVWPPAGPLDGGTILTIGGTGFDGLGRGAGALCQLGGQVAVPATWRAADDVRITVPPAPGGVIGSVALSLTLNGREYAPRCSCSRTCAHSADGSCDDGGADAATALCTFGTDCADCGVRCDQPTTRLVYYTYYEQPVLAQLAPATGPVSGRQLVTVVALGLQNYGALRDARCMVAPTAHSNRH